jgi:flagellar basal-body rod protein FlgC
MNLFTVLEISGSALQAERLRAEVVASNLANAETTHTTQGGPYRREGVVFTTTRVRGQNFAEIVARYSDVAVRGVHVKRVVADPRSSVRRFDPSHPDADKEGYVSFPNINPIAEMVDLMGAARAYQLNVAAVQSTKSMIQQALQIIQ